MTLAFRCAVVFIVAMAVDACWALYMRRAGTGNAVKSANYCVLLIALGMFNTKSWLNDWRLAPAILIGSWLGTYLTVRHDAK